MKSNVRKLSGLLLPAALIFVHTATSATGYRGPGNNLGMYPVEGIQTEPQVRWTADLQSPVIGGVAEDDETVFAVTLDGKLHALEKATGGLRWERTFAGEGRSTPVRAGNDLFFLAGDGTFCRLDPADGSTRWNFSARSPERAFTRESLHYMSHSGPMADFWDYSYGAPLIGDETVYFGASDGHVYALDRATGMKRWEYAADDVIHAPLAAAGDTIVGASFDGTCFALDAGTGELRWRHETGRDPGQHNQQGHTAAPLILHQQVMLAGRDAALRVLDLENGSLQALRRHSMSWILGTPTVHRNRLIYGTSDTGLLLKVRAEHVQDTVREVHIGEPVYAPPVLTPDLLYVGTFGGRLLGLDPETLEVRWIFRTVGHRNDPHGFIDASGRLDLGSAFGQPAYGEGKGAYDACLEAFQRLFSIGPILGSFAVDDGALFFGAADGHLYALESPHEG